MTVKNGVALGWIKRFETALSDLQQERVSAGFDALPFDLAEFYDTHGVEGHPSPAHPGPRFSRETAAQEPFWDDALQQFPENRESILANIEKWATRQNSRLQAWEAWRFKAKAALLAEWAKCPPRIAHTIRSKRRALRHQVVELLAVPSTPMPSAAMEEIWNRQSRRR